MHVRRCMYTKEIIDEGRHPHVHNDKQVKPGEMPSHHPHFSPRHFSHMQLHQKMVRVILIYRNTYLHHLHSIAPAGKNTHMFIVKR